MKKASQLVAALRQCITSKDLEGGRKIHLEAIAASCHTDKYVASALITLYRKCNKMVLAREVFDEMLHPNTINWNCLLLGYVEHGEFSLALHLFHTMSSRSQPDSFTFVAVLKACAGLGGETGLAKGIILHQQLKQLALHSNLVVANTLLDMYCKCGSLVHARHVFDTMACKDVVSWTCLIMGYVKNGEYLAALEMFTGMDCEPDYCACVAALKACAGLGSSRGLEMGGAIHQLVTNRGFDSRSAVSTMLVDMYSKCGSMQQAWEVFQGMKHKPVVAWNCLLLGYVDNGDSLKALKLFDTIDCEPTDVTFLAALKACAALAGKSNQVEDWLHKGRSIHDKVVERGYDSGILLASTLVDMYCKCSCMTLARRVFEKMSRKDVVTWNCLIRGYVENGEYLHALELFESMDCQATDVTYLAALRACVGLAAQSTDDDKKVWSLQKGMEIQKTIQRQGLHSNISVANTLVDMYSKCGNMPEAQKMFDEMKHKDVVSWNCLMTGYVENEMSSKALELLDIMDCQPTDVTCVIALKACGVLAKKKDPTALHKAMVIHEVVRKHGFESDVAVTSSLVDVYSKCGCMPSAWKVFEQIAHKGVVLWNCLILGYVENGESHKALELFINMDIEPSCVSYVGALKACGNLAALPAGKRIHAAICQRGVEQDQLIATGLVDFYRRCGCMDVAVVLFNRMSCPDIESWTALVAGYSSLGDSAQVFNYVKHVVEAGLPLDGVVFTCILTVCSHTGMVDQGKMMFNLMEKKHGITPSLEHYTCMIDMLGRANRLEEALCVINKMPLKADRVTWTTLLGACRKWHNLKVGKVAFQALVAGAGGSNDNAGAAYVLMGEIYTGLSMQREEEQLEEERRMQQAWKKPGESWWTDAQGRTKKFVVGDEIGKKSQEKLLQVLSGYKYDAKNRDEACEHSEKLAIAHALVHAVSNEPIRIVKNMRVCTDCHQATCYISKVENREIIIRDASRFHVFRQGNCSCGGYW